MKILAIETSSHACSVALLNEDKVKISHIISPMQQAKLILPMIDELLKSSALTLNDLDAIAYGCGPGGFTGVRIAASVAQGLGFAVKLPIIPISSLAVMAEAAFLERQWRKLLVAVDARADQIYWIEHVTESRVDLRWRRVDREAERARERDACARRDGHRAAERARETGRRHQKRAGRASDADDAQFQFDVACRDCEDAIVRRIRRFAKREVTVQALAENIER